MRVEAVTCKYPRRWFGIVVLAWLGAGLTAVNSSSYPFEVFRRAVGDAEYIVVGRIVSTSPIDSTVRERISGLLIEEVVVGDLDVGDLLSMEWNAATWYPSEDVVMHDYGINVALDELEGVPAFWCLVSAQSGASLPLVGYWCEPLLLTAGNCGAVEAAIEDLRTKLIVKRVHPEPEDMEDRINAVGATLGLWLEQW